MDTPSFPKNWNPAPAMRGLPIQKRLPLLISGLLLTVMISFSLIAYLGVRNSTLNIGKERLMNISNQLSNMLAQSVQSMRTSIGSTAKQPAIIETFETKGGVLPPEAERLIQKMREDTTIMLVELLDADKKSFLHWGKDSVEYRVDFQKLMHDWPAVTDTVRVGKFHQVHDSLYVPAMAAVYGDTQLLGYIVRWHLLKSSPEAIEQLSQILGAKSSLYIGNTDKSVWTDMRSPVKVSAAIDTAVLGKIIAYNSIKGDRVLGVMQPISNSSWLVLIEFSEAVVLEAATRFVKWLVLIGAIILAAGIFFGWVMSRNITKPLKRLTRAAPTIAAGDYSATVDLNRRDEVGKLARALNAMAVQVGNAKKELEKKVIETEDMNLQLRSLSAHLQNVREEERIHIARDMHDELGQLLTGFKMDIAWLQKRIGTEIDPVLVDERLTAMKKGIDEAVQFVRKLAADLRPSLLDDLGIVPALEWYSQEFQKRFMISVDFKSSVGDLDISNEQATGLFRMYQESLTNVARHANASAVVASFGIQDQRLALSVVDNGKGFEISSKGKLKTLGLLGMKERAGMIGGKLEISSAPGKGTRVFITMPLPSLSN